MNNRGFTLLEMMIALVILGMTVPYFGRLIVDMNVMITKANKANTDLATQVGLARTTITQIQAGACSCNSVTPSPSPRPHCRGQENESSDDHNNDDHNDH